MVGDTAVKLVEIRTELDPVLRVGADLRLVLVAKRGDRVCGREHRACVLLRTPAEAAMSWIYILSGVLAAAIFVYLVIALLYPEKF